MSKNTFGNLLVAAGLTTLPKEPKVTKPRHATVSFLSMTGREGSRMHASSKRRPVCPPGLYRKIDTQEIVRVSSQSAGRVYFATVGCGTVNVEACAQDDADSLPTEVFAMAYKPYTSADPQKA